MTEIITKRKKNKRNKLKRWSVVFVEDSDDERYIKNNKVQLSEKIIHTETDLLQQISKSIMEFP